jgi:hypothetical protein
VGEDRGQIEREISAERRALGRNLHELQDRAKAMRDWRVHYRKHPGLALGLAFGGGVVLAAIVGGRSRRAVGEEGDADVEFVEPIARRWRPPGEFRSQIRQHVNDSWQQVVHALLGVATTKAVDFVSDRVPGFRDEFDRQGGSDIPAGSDSIH